jgi:hypothetical protein
MAEFTGPFERFSGLTTECPSKDLLVAAHCQQKRTNEEFEGNECGCGISWETEDRLICISAGKSSKPEGASGPYTDSPEVLLKSEFL